MSLRVRWIVRTCAASAGVLVVGNAFAQDPPKPGAKVDVTVTTPAPPPGPKVDVTVKVPAAAPPPKVVVVVAPKKLAPGDLPPPALRLWLAAPTADGMWTIRIDNDDARPARVPADIRLLHFTIQAGEGRARKTYRCGAPPAMVAPGFPERRALLLAPGQSYIESFDPHLFCFGKNADALVGGATVHVFLGWDGPVNTRANIPPPYVGESTDEPSVFRPIKRLDAPAIELSYATLPHAASWVSEGWVAPNAPGLPRAPEPKPNPTNFAVTGGAQKGDKPVLGKPLPVVAPIKPEAKETVAVEKEPEMPHVVDEHAPRFGLTTTPWIDASDADRVLITVTAKNVGFRPMLVVLRPRMLGFRFEGPDGVSRCDTLPPTGGVPRDAFQTLRPGQAISMTLVLAELCSRDAFSRPGIYRLHALLDANERGPGGTDAFIGRTETTEPTMVRIAAGPESFYEGPPRSRPTPLQAAEEDEAE